MGRLKILIGFLFGWFIGNMLRSENKWVMGAGIFMILYISVVGIVTLVFLAITMVYVKKAMDAVKNGNTELANRYVEKAMKLCFLQFTFWAKFAPYLLPKASNTV